MQASKFPSRCKTVTNRTNQGRPRTGRVRLFPFTYARFATKQQECFDEDSEAEVECWKPGRAVSRVSPHCATVMWEQTETPVVISLTTAFNYLSAFKKERQEENCNETRLYDTGFETDNRKILSKDLFLSNFPSYSKGEIIPGETSSWLMMVEWQRV